MAKPKARTRPREESGRWPENARQILAESGIALDDGKLAALCAHFELLVRWNRTTNLTAIRDPEEIVRRHFAESLFLANVIRLGPGLLYDIGSGAGFPGLPLKVARPELNVVLVESSLKKAAFLKEVIRFAGLAGARVEAVRVEQLVERAEVERADWVTMRAVGKMDELLPVVRRLLVPHGQVALFLGQGDAARVGSDIGGFAWHPPARIPGSERRVILVGDTAAV